MFRPLLSALLHFANMAFSIETNQAANSPNPQLNDVSDHGRVNSKCEKKKAHHHPHPYTCKPRHGDQYKFDYQYMIGINILTSLG